MENCLNLVLTGISGIAFLNKKNWVYSISETKKYTMGMTYIKLSLITVTVLENIFQFSHS